MSTLEQRYAPIRNRWQHRPQSRLGWNTDLATAGNIEISNGGTVSRLGTSLRFFLTLLLLALTILPTVAQVTGDFRLTEKLVLQDGARLDNFGHSVATDGRMALIGAPWKANQQRGSAYLFDTSTGDHLATFVPDEGGFHEKFGVTVALDGNRALVGTDAGHAIGGNRAYVFDVQTRQKLAVLVPNDVKLGSFFSSRSLSLSGDLALVGDAFDDDNDGSDTGSAYVFDITTGQQIAKLLVEDGISNNFGIAVSISGDRALVGSLDGGYLFDARTGRQLIKFVPDLLEGRNNPDWFFLGQSVSLQGSRALIGAAGGGGRAYLFDTESGAQLARLIPNDLGPLDEFGASVWLHDNFALIGAPRAKVEGVASGSAYIFDAESGRQLSKFIPQDGDTDDEFGRSVSMGDTAALIGSRWDDDKGLSSGSAYLFANPTGGLSLTINTHAQSLSLQAPSGAIVQIEGTDDLATGTWSPLTTLTGSDSPVLWDDPSEASHTQYFYRAVVTGTDGGSGVAEPEDHSYQLGQDFVLPEIQLEMVAIAPGTFTMGSPVDEQDRRTNEGPATQVTLSAPYWIGKYELTRDQWKEIMGYLPINNNGDGQIPVSNIALSDASSFCSRLNTIYSDLLPADYRFDLPTEAQWEYACQAGTTTRFSFGDDPEYASLPMHGNFCDRDCNRPWRAANFDDGHGTFAPVGTYLPNPWGLFDMHGNLGEWCADDFFATYDSGASVTDPFGEPSTVYRGGDFQDIPAGSRSAGRKLISAGLRAAVIGFRVALTPIR